MSEAAALVALAACLGAAVARPTWAPDWAVAAVAAVLLVLTGVLSEHAARRALSSLAPTVGFLAALLVLADGCRRLGVFDALGGVMASHSGARPQRLLAIVVSAAALTTAVLSLDATVVLLTPVVFATAARMRANTRPQVYACSHLANSASLLLPISNLTNLLAFQSSSLSFARFAELMVLPWAAAIIVEWTGLRRCFRDELRGRAAEQPHERGRPRVPRYAVAVVSLTLAGFGLSSLIGIAPALIAGVGAIALAVRARPPVPELIRCTQPPLLVFVLGLGVVVRAASDHGLRSAVESLVPHGSTLPELLAVAAIAAVLANLVNNLPATLIMLPVVTASSPGAVLAMLIGVNAGPNLTYTGSLATLLWRRVVHAHEHETDLREFTKLGLITVPPTVLACTAALWLALQLT